MTNTQDPHIPSIGALWAHAKGTAWIAANAWAETRESPDPVDMLPVVGEVLLSLADLIGSQHLSPKDEAHIRELHWGLGRIIDRRTGTSCADTLC